MKLFGWLCKMIAIAIVTAAISAVTTLYVMNIYMQEMLKPVQAIWPTKPMSLSDLAAKWGSGLNITGLPGAPLAEKEKTSQPERAKPESSQQGDAVAAWSQNGAGETRGKEKVMISAEEFQKRREKLSEEDKATVFSILISQLPQEELQHISTKLEDGLTATELDEIEKTAAKYLQPEQFAKLMEIVNK